MHLLSLRVRLYSTGLYPNPYPFHYLYPLWDGDVEQGKRLVNRRFTLAGCDISFSRQIGWYSQEGSLDWLKALHSFSWIADMAAYAPDRHGAAILRGYIEDWIAASEYLHVVAHEPAIIGERLFQWLIYSSFILLDAPPSFRRRWMRSIIRQALSLRKILRKSKETIDIQAIKGLLFASLYAPGCRFLLREVLLYLKNLLITPLLEGKPEKRNPMWMHDTLRSLLEIQHGLKICEDREEQRLNEAIYMLAYMVQSARHGRHGFALFHGATEGNPCLIEQTLNQVQKFSGYGSEMAAKAAMQITDAAVMERSGYAQLDAGLAHVIVDVAAPSLSSSTESSRQNIYNSALAFEMSHAGQRYIVNCGAFIGNNQNWDKVMRTTAAHSTICMDDRNSVLLAHPANSENTSLKVDKRLIKQEGYQFLEASFNGYSRYSGLRHIRQLLINQEGTRFSGTDRLVPDEDYNGRRPHDIMLRFHLHPSLLVKRRMNGSIVLYSPRIQEEWIFQSSAGQTTILEDSIYLGLEGKPVPSQQISIYAPFVPNVPWCMEWSLIRNEE